MGCQRVLRLALVTSLTVGCAGAQATAAKPRGPKADGAGAAKAPTRSGPQLEWVARSNQYTRQLLDIQFKYSPEGGSSE
jgi:hypothetical protein